MSIYFFDSSAIVKRYIKETGTDWVVEITNPAKGGKIYIARITGVEVISAIARRGKNGDISKANMDIAIAYFKVDFARAYRVVELTPPLIARAMSLAGAHALRGYDAVQLAATLEVNNWCLKLSIPALTLVSADKALNEAANTEGLTVEDANAH